MEELERTNEELNTDTESPEEPETVTQDIQEPEGTEASSEPPSPEEEETDGDTLEAAEEEVREYGKETVPPVPEGQIQGSIYSDRFFNIPPVLGAMDGLDRETFWSEVAAAKPKRKRPSAAVIILAVLMLLVMTLVFVTAINGRGWLVKLINGGKNIEFTLPTADKPRLDDSMYQDDGRYTIEGLAEAVSPSVVALEIFTSKTDLLPNSQGSGIIMTSDGYIVTNAHVVEKAAKIKVVLSNKSEYSADVIGSDEGSDIAVVKIGAKDLKPAEYGDSDKVNLGEDVVCIGSPAGFYGSITKGIVSGVNRLIKVESFSTPMKCIQVDAAINPGNSGGALFNMWGQVIGITSSKLSNTKYDGIGFAISINAARPIIEELVSVGYLADKARIGVTYYMVSEETAASVKAKPGMLIAEIDPECDISGTELKQGDIITTIDGVALTDSEVIKKLLEKHSPGDTVTSRIFRPNEDGEGGTEFDITYKLEKDKSSFIEKESK